jgi:hypothetical protein
MVGDEIHAQKPKLPVGSAVSARTGIVETKRQFSGAPAPGDGPPENAKPATAGTGTGSNIALKNSTKTHYQVTTETATINERQAWHAVRFFNSAPSLTRETRRVGLALVILARAVRNGEARGEEIAREAGLSTGKTVAGLHALATAGLVRRTLTGGLTLNWQSLQ